MSEQGMVTPGPAPKCIRCGKDFNWEGERNLHAGECFYFGKIREAHGFKTEWRTDLDLENPTKQIIEALETLCKHQFFEISKVYRSEKIMEGYVFSSNCMSFPDGIITMCALCGERRHLHADGRVEILNKEV